MFEIVCVTHRALCGEAFLTRIDKIADVVDGVILREKDLQESEYERLAADVLSVCARHETACALHTFAGAAARLHARAIHLSLYDRLSLGGEALSAFSRVGVSCHSLSDVLAAQKGASYVTVGHIFATDCKRGLPGRGLSFLREICRHAEVPVYAIGGIGKNNIAAVRDAGASGACIMSGLMTCGDPAAYVEELRNALR